jgi:hypothetical protein
VFGTPGWLRAFATISPLPLALACGGPTTGREPAVSQPRDDERPFVQGIAPSGRTCQEGDPDAIVTVLGYSKWKPPLRLAALDVIASNPSQHPLWFVLDLTEASSRLRLERVRVSRLAAARPAYAWEFETAVHYSPTVSVNVPDLVAVRVAAGAQAVLRDVRRMVNGAGSASAFWIASDITVDGIPVEQWLGVDGVTEGGEVEFKLPPSKSDPSWVERHGSQPGQGNVEIHVVCEHVFVATE